MPDGGAGVRGDFAYLRQVLDERYAALPAPVLRAHMEAAFGPDAAEAYDEYLEGVFDDIGNFIKKAAPVVTQVGGGALQGALAGSSLGLPGIIGGALAGGAGAGLKRYGSGTARDIGGVLSGVTNIAGQLTPMGRLGTAVGPAISGLAGGGRGGGFGPALGAVSGLLGPLAGGAGAAGAAGAAPAVAGAAAPALGGLAGLLGSGGGAAGNALGVLTSLFGGSSAINQLNSLLGRPETTMALEALRMRDLGRRTVPVGSAGTPVPATAIAGLVSKLAAEACAEAASYTEDAEADLGYMTDGVGEFVGDPALERDRAARVWNLLNEAQAERVLSALAEAMPRASPRRFNEAAEDIEALEEAYYGAYEAANGEAYGEDLAEWNGAEWR